jgi:hypothetical protein
LSTTYTANLGLGEPATGDRGWGATMNANLSLLDASCLGALAVSLTETPSTTLRVAVAPGSFLAGGRNTVTYAGTSAQTLTASATNYVYLTDAGTLTVSTSSFPTTGNFVALAIVTTSSSAVTAIAEARTPWRSAGGHQGLAVGTPTIAAGTGAGTSPTIAIAGSDQAGVITLTAGSSPSASATVATVTFGQGFAATPQALVIVPGNAATAAIAGWYGDKATLSTSVFKLNTGSTALTGAGSYVWFYFVMG